MVRGTGTGTGTGAKGMILQKQPNRASCLLTSFAMAIGVPVGDLTKSLGFDGTEIIFPELPIPSCYRGHHEQECLHACMKLGYYFSSHEMESVGGHDLEQHYKTEVPWDWSVILESNCVMAGEHISGSSHAVAWNAEEQKIYDPNGSMYDMENFKPTVIHKLIL